MKMSTASNMCTLSCALIVCTLVTAARTTNTNTDDPNKPTRVPFDERETTTGVDVEDWKNLPSTAPTANEKYGSEPTLSTPPVTDLNDSPLYPNELVTVNAINISTTPGNDYIPSDKKISYTTEPIPTTNSTQLLAEPPTRTQPLTTTPTANGRYNSKMTPVSPSDTPSGTNLNDTMQGDEAIVSPSKDDIGNSQTPENNKYSSTEPNQTNDHTQTTLKESPTRMTSTARTATADDGNVTKFNSTDDKDWKSRVQLPNSTFTAIQKDGSTTPGTPSVTDPNVKPQQDVIGNSTSQPKPKDGYNLSHKKYSSTKSIPANNDTRSKPKKSKTKWSNDPIPSIWFTTKRPTRYYRTTEWIKPTKNCKCEFSKQHSSRCKKNEKETTTTKVWGRFAEYKRWDEQRHMSETTTNNVQEQLEKSKKRKIQQKVLEMESNRLNTILDVFNSR